MKKLYLIIGLFLIILPSTLFAQQYPLQVMISQRGKFTPFIGKFIENPGQYLSLRVTQSPGNSQSRRIYFGMKLQQITPSTSISVISNVYSKPLNPIEIRAMGSTEITANQIKDNFGNFSNSNDFQISGINIKDFTNIHNSLRIPEGQYKLCFTAYDFDAMQELVPLSDPNMVYHYQDLLCCFSTKMGNANELISRGAMREIGDNPQKNYYIPVESTN